MKTKSMQHILAAAAFAFTGAASAQEAETPVNVSVEGLPPHVAQKVTEAAKQGSTELRRYINRTRMINELNYNAIARDDESTAIAKQGSGEKVAVKGEDKSK